MICGYGGLMNGELFDDLVDAGSISQVPSAVSCCRPARFESRPACPAIHKRWSGFDRVELE
jgi:hypothetical protein